MAKFYRSALLALLFRPASPSVSVVVTAPWLGSDPSVEAAALLNWINGSLVSDYWAAWAANGCATSVMRCTLDAIDRQGLPPLTRQALGAALAARLEAPRVEAWARAWSRLAARAPPGATGTRSACVPFACGTAHASVAEALEALGSAACASTADDAPVPELEHELGHGARGPHASREGSGPAGRRLLAHVDPHAAGFGEALTELRRAAAAGARVFLRYRPAPASADGVPLQGFAATVRIKSSEYKTVDDRAAAQHDADDTDDADEDDATGGSDASEAPSWLLRRKGAERPSSTLRYSRHAAAALPTQAAIAVLRSRSPLPTLRDVSSSLPSLAAYLSRIRPSSAAHAARADALSRLWPHLRSSRGTVALNGKPLDLDREDAMHAAVAELVGEAAAAASLVELGVSARGASTLLQMAPPSPLRLAMSYADGSVAWLGGPASPSHAAQLEGWPAALAKAGMRGSRGAVQFTSHELHAAVFALDPGTVGGAALGGHAAALVRRGAPLRIGVMLHATGDADGVASVGRRAAAIAHAAAGREGLLAFLKSAAAEAGDAGGGAAAEASRPLPDAAIEEALRSALASSVSDGKPKKSSQE